jgi:hypothetical protein
VLDRGLRGLDFYPSDPECPHPREERLGQPATLLGLPVRPQARQVAQVRDYLGRREGSPGVRFAGLLLLGVEPAYGGL